MKISTGRRCPRDMGIDVIRTQLAVLLVREEEVQAAISTARREANVARALLGSFQEERFALTQAADNDCRLQVQVCLRSSFLVRIRKLPPIPKCDSGERVSLTVTHGCSRPDFVHILRLCDIDLESDLDAAALLTCVARVADSAHLLKALNVPGELTKACLSRAFLRNKTTKLRRSIVQRPVEDNGRERLLLGRDVMGKRVPVAESESDELDVSTQSYVDGLVSKTVDAECVRGLGPSPSIFVWRAHHLAGDVDGAKSNTIGTPPSRCLFLYKRDTPRSSLACCS